MKKTSRETEESKRVGIWIRVSTEDQARGESPKHHEERARQYAISKEWRVIELYDLAGVSGKAVLEHPEARRMLRDVERGHITGLIFSKLARLGRNTRELLEIAEFFQKHGADLISLAESVDTSTPSGRFFFTTLSAMATWEREEIVERITASVPIRAKLGKPLGGKPPYGYRWVDKKMVPDPATAPIRRLVHELYLKHRRKNAVARVLNEAGHRTQNGKPFTAASVRVMLHDPTPKGTHRANYMTASRVRGERYKSEEHWIYHPVEPILPTELWDSCYQVLKDQEASERPRAKTPVQVFGGLTWCGRCGGKMYVPSNSPKYVCGKCPNKIAIEDLEAIFLTQIRSYFLSAEEVREYLAGADRELKQKEELLSGLQKERDRLRQEMDRVFKLYMEEQLSTTGFGERYRPMEERMGQLQTEIPKLEGQIDYLKVNILSQDEVFSQGQDLVELWSDMAPEEKQRAAECLVRQIVIGADTGIEIDLYYRPDLLAQGMKDPTNGNSPSNNDPNDPNHNSSPETLILSEAKEISNSSNPNPLSLP